MSESYTQANRKFQLQTPLGKDVLLFKGISGSEGISRLFEYTVHAMATNDTEISFEALLGQKVTVVMKMGKGEDPCYLNGICKAVAQKGQDETFTAYWLALVPEFWFLTRKAQSRIFQQMTVPDILKKVMKGVTVTWELKGKYEPRDYCVQYRETDFNFASRLMEEEGIFYFFKHSSGNHEMVVADSASSHQDVPGESQLIYEELFGGIRDEERILSWEKVQEVRSGKSTLWDHCFEVPHQNLEAQEPILSTVTAGKVTHKLKVAGNDSFEIYDWPGEYAQRFDGVSPGGGDRKADIQKIFQDNQRTVKLRMGEETVPSLVIRGHSNCRHLRSGHKFTLKRHFNADGSYVILESQIEAEQLSDYRSGVDQQRFSAGFACIPASLPYRPPRVTPKPVVPGTQSAVVVGPKGEELFTDKYGRVKVQFHWDREGKRDADSSCWIRVVQPIAGRRWGFSVWPRIGQEVIVDFVEGDPDNPIIVGVVYNADQMPPYLGDGNDSKHKNDNKVSGFKSNTTMGGAGYNEFRFDDTKDKQEIFIHAERDMDVRVENDLKEKIHGNRHLIVGPEGKDKASKGDYIELINQDRHITVKRNHDEKIEGSMRLLVKGNEDTIVQGSTAMKVQGSRSFTVNGDVSHSIDGAHSVRVVGNWQSSVVGRYALSSASEIHIFSSSKIVLQAPQITIAGAGGFVSVDPSGVTIMGALVKINSGGSPATGAGSSPKNPTEAKEAKPQEPKEADNSVTGTKSS